MSIKIGMPLVLTADELLQRSTNDQFFRGLIFVNDTNVTPMRIRLYDVNNVLLLDVSFIEEILGWDILNPEFPVGAVSASINLPDNNYFITTAAYNSAPGRPYGEFATDFSDRVTIGVADGSSYDYIFVDPRVGGALDHLAVIVIRA